MCLEPSHGREASTFAIWKVCYSKPAHGRGVSLSDLAIGEDAFSMTTVWCAQDTLISQEKCFKLIKHQKRSVIEPATEDTHIQARNAGLKHTCLEGVPISRTLGR